MPPLLYVHGHQQRKTRCNQIQTHKVLMNSPESNNTSFVALVLTRSPRKPPTTTLCLWRSAIKTNWRSSSSLLSAGRWPTNWLVIATWGMLITYSSKSSTWKLRSYWNMMIAVTDAPLQDNSRHPMVCLSTGLVDWVTSQSSDYVTRKMPGLNLQHVPSCSHPCYVQ